MVAIVIAATLLGSLSNAASSVLQRRAAGTPRASELFSPHFIQAVIRQKRWLLGEALDILGFCLQALALKFGVLSIVEPLMMANLLFLLLILAWRFRIPMTWREWGGGLAICAGLAALLLIARPHGEQLDFNGDRWLLTGGLAAVFIIGGAIAVRYLPRPNWRAALAGTVAGVNFALTAALTKLVVGQFQYGIGHVVGGWEIWALLASGATALLTMQSAFGAGPLAVSTPAMQIVDPLLGVLIGVLVFGDIINLSPLAVALELLCGLVIAGGVVLLAGSTRIQQHAHL